MRSTSSPQRSSSGSARSKNLHGRSGGANANRSHSAGLLSCYGLIGSSRRRYASAVLRRLHAATQDPNWPIRGPDTTQATQRHKTTKKPLRLAKTLVSAVCRMTISGMTQALTRRNRPIVTVCRLCRIRYLERMRNCRSTNAAKIAATHYDPTFKSAEHAAPATSKQQPVPHDLPYNLHRLQHSNGRNRTGSDHPPVLRPRRHTTTSPQPRRDH